MIWLERGGRGAPDYLLLHGLGATGAVWHGVCAALDERAAGSWIVCDLPGHGDSDTLADYSIGALAAVIAAATAPAANTGAIKRSLVIMTFLRIP